jgi:hypothetical protein
MVEVRGFEPLGIADDSPPHDVTPRAIKACLRPHRHPRARAFSLCPNIPKRCDPTF